MNHSRFRSATLVAFPPSRPSGRAPNAGRDDDAPEARPDLARSSVDATLPLRGRALERALIDAWREAHWSLRLKLEEVGRRYGPLGIDALYDEARRCDNLLNELYQSRAEVLARHLRESSEAHAAVAAAADVAASVAPPCAVPPVGLSVTERALLARVRDMAPGDRASLLRLAVRMSAAAGPGSQR